MSQNRSYRIIDRHELKRLIPYSLTHIGRLEAQGRFPQRIRLGANRIGWLHSEVVTWITELAERRSNHCSSADDAGQIKK